jgi:hypothetical protein
LRSQPPIKPHDHPFRNPGPISSYWHEGNQNPGKLCPLVSLGAHNAPPSETCSGIPFRAQVGVTILPFIMPYGTYISTAGQTTPAPSYLSTGALLPFKGEPKGLKLAYALHANKGGAYFPLKEKGLVNQRIIWLRRRS